MLDIEKLKKLALSATSDPWREFVKPVFMAEANPEAILELIAEIERLRKYEPVEDKAVKFQHYDALSEAVRQVKAESKALFDSFKKEAS